jgi:hypothetical protein
MVSWKVFCGLCDRFDTPRFYLPLHGVTPVKRRRMFAFKPALQEGDRDMRTVAKVDEDYIAAWNEVDATRRRAMLESTWTAAATYVDPVAQGAGLAEIDNIIGSVQRRFPGLIFSLSGNADGHANIVRFLWALGPKDGAAIVKGTDFVVRPGDKIATVTGFLDLVPTPA